MLKLQLTNNFFPCFTVGRLIKYTGYGNAAGLLANRGLMIGRQDLSHYERDSDSEDSETEEYIELEDK